MRVLDVRKDDAHKPTYLGLPLKSGQIVLTESPDATSMVFVLIPKTFYNFTHAAVVSMENGEPYVYEVSGGVSTFPIHTRVLDNVSGGVHRRSFYEHVAPNLYAEVFDPPEGTDGERIASFAREKYKAGAEFDAYFRYDEHEKLFCTEMVELALEFGGAKPLQLVPTNDNPSLRTGMKWLGVPLETALPAGLFADPARYVGALGQFPSRTAAYAYFEAKHEIHRRFTKDQRVGYLFHLKGSGMIDVRPEVGDFMNRATHLFDDADPQPPPGDERITRSVRALADVMFGPVALATE
jgi:hypothetical protein